MTGLLFLTFSVTRSYQWLWDAFFSPLGSHCWSLWFTVASLWRPFYLLLVSWVHFCSPWQSIYSLLGSFWGHFIYYIFNANLIWNQRRHAAIWRSLNIFLHFSWLGPNIDFGMHLTIQVNHYLKLSSNPSTRAEHPAIFLKRLLHWQVSQLIFLEGRRVGRSLCNKKR